jgi:hypothetical protein
MRNSEPGCGGTEQRCGIAAALSCGDTAARSRWCRAMAAWRSGDAVARGCESDSVRCYWFSKRSNKELDDISISAHPSASLLIYIMCVCFLGT